MKIIVLIPFLFLMSACGGGGGGAGSSETKSDELVRSFLSMIIPTASAVEIPDGAIAKVSIDGPSGSQSIVIDPDDPPHQFTNLLVGDYSISVVIENGGLEIGSYFGTVNLSDSGASVTADIVFNRAELVVDPVVASDYEFLEHSYDGVSRVIGVASCITDNPFNTDSSNIDVTIDGEVITLDVKNFFGENLLMDGVLDDSSGALLASGTYQSSDFTEGAWNLTYLSTPTDQAISFLIDMTNETDSCSVTYEYAGLIE